MIHGQQFSSKAGRNQGAKHPVHGSLHHSAARWSPACSSASRPSASTAAGLIATVVDASPSTASASAWSMDSSTLAATEASCTAQGMLCSPNAAPASYRENSRRDVKYASEQRARPAGHIGDEYYMSRCAPPRRCRSGSGSPWVQTHRGGWPEAPPKTPRAPQPRTRRPSAEAPRMDRRGAPPRTGLGLSLPAESGPRPVPLH